jgi:hypothetical protein
MWRLTVACQDGYIALRCKNFELVYDNLRKLVQNLYPNEANAGSVDLI